jgi:hypothetical protein
MKQREALERAHRLRLKWRDGGGAQVVVLQRRAIPPPEEPVISDAEVVDRVESGELRPLPSAAFSEDSCSGDSCRSRRSAIRKTDTGRAAEQDAGGRHESRKSRRQGPRRP